jgi:hypothetical protein
MASGNKKMISPGADSLLAVTVGADFLNDDLKPQKTSYTGELDLYRLYHKPNIFDYSNDEDNYTNSEPLCSIEEGNHKEIDIQGTSFSAPLVTRKCAYLMCNYGFTVEAIRAMVNLQAKVNKEDNTPIHLNANLDEYNNNEASCMVYYAGEIDHATYKEQEIILPFENVDSINSIQEFVIATSTAYTPRINPVVGDEYCTTELSTHVIAK